MRPLVLLQLVSERMSEETRGDQGHVKAKMRHGQAKIEE